jgi:hypothetical protein
MTFVAPRRIGPVKRGIHWKKKLNK